MQKSLEEDHPEELHEVLIHAYDLSFGLASLVSEKLLGTHVDGFYHTGLIVRDQEYFFAKGINRTEPDYFDSTIGRCSAPISLGFTSKTPQEFEAYLQSKDTTDKFNEETYHPFTNSCHEFIRFCVKFLLPEYNFKPQEVRLLGNGKLIGRSPFVSVARGFYTSIFRKLPLLLEISNRSPESERRRRNEAMRTASQMWSLFKGGFNKDSERETAPALVDFFRPADLNEGILEENGVPSFALNTGGTVETAEEIGENIFSVLANIGRAFAKGAQVGADGVNLPDNRADSLDSMLEPFSDSEAPVARLTRASSGNSARQLSFPLDAVQDPIDLDVSVFLTHLFPDDLNAVAELRDTLQHAEILSMAALRECTVDDLMADGVQREWAERIVGRIGEHLEF